jgi:hypothetical protein
MSLNLIWLSGSGSGTGSSRLLLACGGLFCGGGGVDCFGGVDCCGGGGLLTRLISQLKC